MCFLALLDSFIPSLLELPHLLIASLSRWHYVTRKHYPGASCFPLSFTSSGESLELLYAWAYSYLLLALAIFPSLAYSHYISAGWKYGETKPERDRKALFDFYLYSCSSVLNTLLPCGHNNLDVSSGTVYNRLIITVVSPDML